MVCLSEPGKKRKKKIEPSQLALDTFAAFEPHTNIFDPGAKYRDYDEDGAPERVGHTIPRYMWDLHRRRKAGERGLQTPKDVPFNPWAHIISKVYSPDHVQRHMDGKQISYFTSSKHGLALAYVDVDTHQTWQTDGRTALRMLADLFPGCYWRPSTRGYNLYIKIRYWRSVLAYNATVDQLQAALRNLLLNYNFLSDLDVNGTITGPHDADGKVEHKSGRLGKLPFLVGKRYFGDFPEDTWDQKATGAVQRREDL
jgi:hypothetical protein